MGVYLSMKKNKIEICFGRSHYVLPDGFGEDDINNDIDCIINGLDLKIKDIVSDIKTLSLFNAITIDQFKEQQLEISSELENLEEFVQKRCFLYIVKDLLDGGYKCVVE